MSSGFCKAFVMMVAMFGATSALDCLSCSWIVKNDTVDHDCLGAPYNLDKEACPGPSPGIKYACQTELKFKLTGGEKSLESVERSCKAMHSNCNNACLEKNEYCWACCIDNDHCNSFPLRANIVTTSAATLSGHAQRAVVTTAALLTTLWTYGILHY